jgi:hypothetical protein
MYLKTKIKIGKHMALLNRTHSPAEHYPTTAPGEQGDAATHPLPATGNEAWQRWADSDPATQPRFGHATRWHDPAEGQVFRAKNEAAEGPLIIRGAMRAKEAANEAARTEESKTPKVIQVMSREAVAPDEKVSVQVVSSAKNAVSSKSAVVSAETESFNGEIITGDSASHFFDQVTDWWKHAEQPATSPLPRVVAPEVHVSSGNGEETSEHKLATVHRSLEARRARRAAMGSEQAARGTSMYEVQAAD